MEFSLDGRKCRVFGSGDILLVEPVGDFSEPEKKYALISERCENIRYAAFEIKDWNSELSPWEAPQVFGDEPFGKDERGSSVSIPSREDTSPAKAAAARVKAQPFGSDARETLRFITDSLLPEIKKSAEEPSEIILGGYSLAGLFSLWCAYQTDIFSAIAAASPSVWFDGWREYILSNEIKTRYVYLSLGSKEHKSRNPVLRSVKDRLTEQYDLLVKNSVPAALEWNEGNHFTDTDIRTAKGFIRCVKALRE